MASAPGYAKRWGLDEHTSKHVLALMEAVPGLRITSGRRSKRRNAAVGGVPDSFHLAGRAVDVVGSNKALKRAAAVAMEQRVSPNCTGPEEVIMEEDHLHLAW